MNPEFKKALLIVFGLLAIVAVAGTGLYFYYNGFSSIKFGSDKPNSSETTTTPEPPSGLSALSPQDQLSAVSAATKLALPAVSSRTAIDSSALPTDILTLTKAYSAVQANSVVYNDKKNGFEVTFNVSKKGWEAYRDFADALLIDKIWYITGAAYSEKSASFGLENSLYVATGQFLQDNSQTQAKILFTTK